MKVRWEGRLLRIFEVKSQEGQVDEAVADIQPGQSLLSLEFSNDASDAQTGEDRNLNIEKVTATGGSR